MRPSVRAIGVVALCAWAGATSAQPRRRTGPTNATTTTTTTTAAAATTASARPIPGLSAECRRCVADARTCLDDGDVPCAVEVLEACRQCGARRSAFVPASHRRGVNGEAAFWTGAAGEPTREQLLAAQPLLRERAERCRPTLPTFVTERSPLEVAFAPSGAAVAVNLPVESIGTEGACLAAAARAEVRVPAFTARHTVLVRFPLDAAAWRRASARASSSSDDAAVASPDASAR